MALLTREKVRELFYYEPSTGWFINRFTRNNTAKKGALAGTIDGKGYGQIGVGGKLYRTHRLVWLYHYGNVPAILDHTNRDRLDNRIENLRPSTLSQNHANRSKSASAAGSRYKGVSRHTHRKWQAQAKVEGVSHHLGLFDDEEDAFAAYCSFMRGAYGEYFAP